MYLMIGLVAVIVIAVLTVALFGKPNKFHAGPDPAFEKEQQNGFMQGNAFADLSASRSTDSRKRSAAPSEEGVRELISRSELDAAFEMAEKLFPGNQDKGNELVVLRGRFSNLLKNERRGVLPRDAVQAERNDISWQLMNWLQSNG